MVLWNSMYTCAPGGPLGKGCCGAACRRVHARWSWPAGTPWRARRRLTCLETCGAMLSLSCALPADALLCGGFFPSCCDAMPGAGLSFLLPQASCQG